MRELGMTMRDLFAGPAETRQASRIAAIYPYQTLDGVLVAQKVRYDPKGFAWRIPDASQRTGFLWGLGDALLPIYRLPELPGEELAFVVEGEKAADALIGLGFAATCAPAGATVWHERFTESLWRCGVRDVVILPDADDPGERHARRVATSVISFSPTNSTTTAPTVFSGCEERSMTAKIVRLPGLSSSGDVVDWLSAGGTPAELKRLTAATMLWFPGKEERERKERQRKQNAARQQRLRDRRKAIRLAARA